MSEERERFIRQLEDAADHVRSLPPADIAVLLRRAALRIRNLPGIDGPKDRDQQMPELNGLPDATP